MFYSAISFYWSTKRGLLPLPAAAAVFFIFLLRLLPLLVRHHWMIAI
jgi:hypothetical protein